MHQLGRRNLQGTPAQLVRVHHSPCSTENLQETRKVHSAAVQDLLKITARRPDACPKHPLVSLKPSPKKGAPSFKENQPHAHTQTQSLPSTVTTLSPCLSIAGMGKVRGSQTKTVALEAPAVPWQRPGLLRFCGCPLGASLGASARKSPEQTNTSARAKWRFKEVPLISRSSDSKGCVGGGGGVRGGGERGMRAVRLPSNDRQFMTSMSIQITLIPMARVLAGQIEIFSMISDQDPD